MSSDQTEPGADTRTRDHLANERTYLAWVRTGVSVMLVGLAVARFLTTDTGTTGHVDPLPLSAGALLVVVGAAGIGYGTIRYRRVAADIDAHRRTRTGQTGSAVVASAVLVLTLITALVLLVLDPS